MGGRTAMTGRQYQAAITLLGLNQQEAGRWLGVSSRTAQNYCRRGPPEPVARLLRLVVMHVSFEEDAFDEYRLT